MKRLSLKTKSLKLVGLCLLALALILPITTSAFAQSGGGYDLTWSTVDGGGATFSTGGGYSLGGSIGQPDAGTMTGAAYSLGGGFWGGVKVLFYRYVPLTLKN
jgi:hypothetical protein